MARLTGPDPSVATVYLTSGSDAGKAKAQGSIVPLYADQALTIPADVQTLAGVTITGSPPTRTVDAYSQIPQFLYPDGVDTVWTSINGGPAMALPANTDQRLDLLGASVAALQATNNLIDAKGDLLVGTADNAPARLAVGSDGQSVRADSSQAAGIKWVLPADVQGGTASGTWTNPSPTIAKPMLIFGFSGGCGGGTGRRGAAGSLRTAGAGGAPGVPFMAWAQTTDFPATVAFTVGAGGTGGAAPTTDDTDGNPGATGGNTFFGALLVTYRIGVPNNSASGGGRGGNSTGAAAAGASAIGGPAGAASSATGAAGAAGGATVLSTGFVLQGPAGGSSGGGISTGNADAAGAAGGGWGAGFANGGTAGTTAGGNAGNGAAGTGLVGGLGGGGGGGNAAGGGGRGGDGGFPGGGGGGAGAGLNGTTGQPGGKGGDGLIRIITFL